MSQITIRLKPKVNARALRHGYPWVFANDLVLDRRTKKIAPGTLAVLEDTERQPIGLVAVHPTARLAARVLDRDPNAQINHDWFAARLSRAYALRARMFPDPYYRLVHAEADGLPGVIIDRFDAICVVQPNAAWVEPFLPDLTRALQEVTDVSAVLKNASSRIRASEGLDDVSAMLAGPMPKEPVPVPMNGATYLADLASGQKTGIFYDQRPNHAFVAGLARDARVLDVFAHVGGFGLAALAHGAAEVMAVDGSRPALALAERSAADMRVSDRFSICQEDAFAALARLGEAGERFDIVICDPPAFAPTKQALEAGLRAYERVAKLSAGLVREGGILTLCSCSHAATVEKFRNASMRGIGRAGRASRLIHTGFSGPDHPILPQLGEGGYLKSLVFAL